MKKKHKVRRSAETGEFVTKEYAEANKSTTVSETVTTGDKGSDNKEDEQEEMSE
jgi:hypothetical protein